ncbi:acetate--CoA ligase [Psychromonas sp. MB-3u-54]|uniref:acetate--CoA ligase n=1 Tax=Psychromonas sp. MB-3u-54 TaxID=2058319 RepID=UPI000C32E2FB|nr:acetate--CoA ligase [Psychromonas sp. MB-3u-54]PKH02383.1 acetate--CoA ligase [Psychromonas sp. MB-3u-54]
MSFSEIKKDPLSASKHNLINYEDTYTHFNWQQAQERIAGNKEGLNIAYEALDRHVKEGFGEQVAIRWLSKQGVPVDISYAELMAQTSRFAHILSSFGVQPNDTVFGLCSRVPQLYIALLGTLKFGAVFSPLFSAFGPEPVRSRMEIGRARLLITSEALYLKKVKPWREQLSSLKWVLLYNVTGPLPDDCSDLDALLKENSADFPARLCDPEHLALLHFTSGTTGKPKGAMHVHQAVVYHSISAFYALDLRPGDRYWCTADPGWVTGTSYGIIAPLCNRVTMIIDEAEFDPEHWYQLLSEQKINVWYTAPTAIRMLMKAGGELAAQYDLSALRFIASVGEPLNPEAVVWGQKVFAMPFHDNWWQTETGGIMIANLATNTVRPGSMGRPLPGIEVAIMEHTEGGQIKATTKANQVGELALKKGWPSMFRGYLHEEQRYQKCFVGDWYLSGDLAMCDADGYYWFIGRADDVIKSSGHLIGPFEVESVLMEHPAVAEVAVIGLPDQVAGEIVKAFVALKPEYQGDEILRKTLLGHSRKRLGAAVAPREIVFRKNLPKTRSGKIMRRLLKARELGLPEGDISTLESDEA